MTVHPLCGALEIHLLGQPIDDHRASAAYRIEVAQALLIKALTEIAGESTLSTRVVGLREAGVHAA